MLGLKSVAIVFVHLLLTLIVGVFAEIPLKSEMRNLVKCGRLLDTGFEQCAF
jgi:hypothetical protein